MVYDRFNGQAMTDNWEDGWIVVDDQTHAKIETGKTDGRIRFSPPSLSPSLIITQFGYIAINYSLDEVS